MGFESICIIAAAVVPLSLISIAYKKITGKEMDFSSSPEQNNNDGNNRTVKWFNDRKLSRRWQVAESMRLANEGKLPVKNKEDRFHLTQRNEDILADTKKDNIS